MLVTLWVLSEGVRTDLYHLDVSRLQGWVVEVEGVVEEIFFSCRLEGCS